ncbi:MAG: hypothetical protein R3F20_13025 [Planctomycetota bacterium]
MSVETEKDCRDFAAMVDADDAGRRPDPEFLRRHLRGCAACRAAAPELVFLYELPAAVPPRPRVAPGARPRRRAGVAAFGLLAAALLIVVVAQRASDPSGDPAPELAPESVAPSAIAEVESRRVERRVRHIAVGKRAVRVEVTEGRWQAPRPSVLRMSDEESR